MPSRKATPEETRAWLGAGINIPVPKLTPGASQAQSAERKRQEVGLGEDPPERRDSDWSNCDAD